MYTKAERKRRAQRQRLQANAVTLTDAVEMNRQYPETFHIAPEEARRSLQVGDWAKLGFQSDGRGERMWVHITKVLGDGKYVGTLENVPVHVPLTAGAEISFEARNILMPMTNLKDDKDAQEKEFEERPYTSYPDKITVSQARAYVAPDKIAAQAVLPVGSEAELKAAGFEPEAQTQQSAA